MTSVSDFILQEVADLARVRAPPPPERAGALLPKAAALRQFEQSRAAAFERRAAQAAAPTYHSTLTTILAPLTHGVAPELGPRLRPVSLANVARRMNAIHAGCVLYARVPLPPWRDAVAAEVPLVDAAGDDAILLYLYNYVLADEDPALVIPQGSFIAVLEPYMRFPRDDPRRGPPMLRCDNPQAIVLFDSEAQWRAAQAGHWPLERAAPLPGLDGDVAIERANRALNDGRVLEAERLYSEALAATPGSVRALANRAAARLQAEDASGALADSESALRLEPGHQKCLFRRADALLQLGRLDEAGVAADALARAIVADALAGAPASDSARSSVRELRDHVARAKAQSERGEYDNAAMEREARSSAAGLSNKGGKGVCSRRHADYESPSIALRDAGGGKGRGVFARAEIPGGSLVMAAKAFAFQASVEGQVERTSTCFSFDRDDGYTRTADAATLTERVIRKLVARPELGRELYALSSGAEGARGDPVPPDSPAALRVDVLRIRGIMANNVFGACPLGANFRLQLRMAASREWLTQVAARPEEQQYGSGLWLRPSLFNHSCLPNCDWHTAGDFLFVRANRSIAAGEELCIAYAPVFDQDFATRAAIFSRWTGGSGFACRCARCEVCRTTPDAAKLELEVDRAFARGTELAGQADREGGRAMSLTEAADLAMPPGRRRAVRAQLEALPLEGQLPLCKLRELDAMALRDEGRFKESLSEFDCIADLTQKLYGARSAQGQLLKCQLRLVVGAFALRHSAALVDGGDRAPTARKHAVSRAREVASRALQAAVATYCTGAWAPLTIEQLRTLAARQCAALGPYAPIGDFDQLLASVVADAAKA